MQCNFTLKQPTTKTISKNSSKTPSSIEEAKGRLLVS